VIVAVLDSGIDSLHNRFQNAFWKYDGNGICTPENVVNDIGYDFVNKDRDPDDLGGHSTAINGILVENFPNDLNLDLMNLKFYEDGKSTLFDAICAIYYAIEQGADILNLSWGFESAEFPSILQDALDYAACNDVLVLTSAGNTGRNNDDLQKYPSNFSEVNNNIISVAAYEVDENGQNQKLSGYSNFGQKVDIAARGFFETTGLDNTFVSLSGTSLATPAVSRVAAIIKARYPQLSALDIKDCILSTVDDYDFNIATSGALNENAALNCAINKMTSICESDRIQLNANVIEESCVGNDGSIDLIVTGEVQNSSFEWSNNASSEDLNNLSAGNYTVTATDDCGCIKILMVEVQNECNGGNCQSERVINNNPMIGMIYRSSDSIESAGKVQGGTNVEFRAGQVIELKAGFHAEKDADFVAKIEGCTPSANNEAEARSDDIIDSSMQLAVFPNPAVGQTTIRYFLSKSEKVQIGLHDLNGRLLQTVAAQQGEVGWNITTLSVDHLAAGIYFVRLQSSDNQMIEKLMVGE